MSWEKYKTRDFRFILEIDSLETLRFMFILCILNPDRFDNLEKKAVKLIIYYINLMYFM